MRVVLLIGKLGVAVYLGNSVRFRTRLGGKNGILGVATQGIGRGLTSRLSCCSDLSKPARYSLITRRAWSLSCSIVEANFRRNFSNVAYGSDQAGGNAAIICIFSTSPVGVVAEPARDRGTVCMGEKTTMKAQTSGSMQCGSGTGRE